MLHTVTGLLLPRFFCLGMRCMLLAYTHYRFSGGRVLTRLYQTAQSINMIEKYGIGIEWSVAVNGVMLEDVSD